MGLFSSVKGLLQTWSGKRKREEDANEPTTSSTNKRARVNSYTLTPVHGNSKEATEIRQHYHFYNYNEEIKSSETRTIEFKQGGVLFDCNKLNQLIGRYGSAFLNSEGGVLLAGVTDSGYVKGLSIGPRDEARIRAGVRNEIEKFRPIVTSDLWGIEFVPVKGTGNPRLRIADKLVVEISFKKGNIENIYENSSHQVYLRRDGGVQGPLRPLDLKNLVISRYNETLKLRKKKLTTEQGSLSSIKSNPVVGSVTAAKKSVTIIVDDDDKKRTKEEEEKRSRLEKAGIKFIKY